METPSSLVRTVPELVPEHALSRSTVRVRLVDTDLMGVVHHSNYLVYFEAGHTEWLRHRGASYADWALKGVYLAIVESRVLYRAPACSDDLLTLETRLVQLRLVSVTFETRVLREETLVAEGSVRLACTDPSHEVEPFPEELLAVFASPERA